jgi:hypothetical protein
MNRRSLIKKAGVAATGVAGLGIAGAQAAEAEPQGEVVAPSGPVPAEPVVAFVRDAKRGEVTVVAGTRETTYRDPALVARLAKAAGSEEVR